MRAFLRKEFGEGETQPSATASDIYVLDTGSLFYIVAVINGRQERTKPFGSQPLLKNMTALQRSKGNLRRMKHKTRIDFKLNEESSSTNARRSPSADR
jgi:hypothetical protein